jgi:ankyrin repeat protein
VLKYAILEIFTAFLRDSVAAQSSRMRLLKRDENGEFVFTRMLHDPPPYAILSHTWSSQPDAEVLYQDILDGTAKSKPSFDKITFIAERAKKEDLEYFWVDSCCINKRDDHELSTAIRSMYRWYARSAVCFVYLTGVSFHKRGHDGEPKWGGSFRTCSWFKRGWTLQELLAPSRVEFYAQTVHLGTRSSLSQEIHDITGIHIEALRGKSPKDFSIPTRFRWANGRQTTVPEDLAYSLMGLCGITILPMYGEGRAGAERRLEQEVRNTFGDAVLDLASGLVPGRSESRQQNRVVPPALLEARSAKLEALDFDMIDSRKADIAKALKSTCTWILTHQTYLQWKDIEASKQHFGFFWIKGHPGAGKSVLIKFLDLHTSKSKGPRDTCISFYFHARGEHLEKSLEGMYRSLLTQLLRSNDDLQVVLDNFRNDDDSRNMLRRLRVLFSAAVAKLEDRRLFCFIDALDECDAENMQDTINYFRGLCEEAAELGIDVFICFASRYYPTLDIPTALQLELDTVDDHHDDLRRYVTSQRFSPGMPGKTSSIPTQVQNNILIKANGVFLWVVLVVEILKKEFSKGNIHTVKSRLEELPPDLATLFKDIVQRDQENVDEFLLCLTWILHAKRRLTLKEFYFAMVEDYDTDFREWGDDILEGLMHKFLRNSSKGLAELTKGKASRVQFIHESVRDFLLRGNGLRYVDPGHNTSICHANEKLKRCCMRGMQPSSRNCLLAMKLEDNAEDLDDEMHRWRPSQRSTERELLKDRYPFMEYAVKYVFIHSDQAVPEIPQWDFIRELDFDEWRARANWLQQHDVNVYAADTTLAYVFAQGDCASLIGLLEQQNINLHVPTTNRNRLPLFTAFANGSMNAARVLLENYGIEDSPAIVSNVMVNNHEGRAAYDIKSDLAAFKWACERGHEGLSKCFVRGDAPPADIRRAFIQSIRAAIGQGKTAILARMLSIAEEIGDVSAGLHSVLLDVIAFAPVEDLKLLLRCVDINASNRRGTALLQASDIGLTEIVQLLLEKGADANAQTVEHGTALYRASEKGFVEIVQLLLEHGAQVNAQAGEHGTALYRASKKGFVKIVRLLVEHGADVNAQGARYGNALQAASANALIEIVKLLLDGGANVNAQGGCFGSALQATSLGGHTKVAELLLEHGADVNAQGGYYGNALQAASYDGSIEVVKLLLEHGADVNAQGGQYGTALQAASYGGSGSIEIVKLLLEHGAGMHSKDVRYEVALQYAPGISNKDVEDLLRGTDADRF